MLFLFYWSIFIVSSVVPNAPITTNRDSEIQIGNPSYTSSSELECNADGIIDRVSDIEDQDTTLLVRSTMCKPALEKDPGNSNNGKTPPQVEQAPAVRSSWDRTKKRNRCPDNLHQFVRVCGGPEVGVYPANMILNCINGKSPIRVSMCATGN